MIGAEHVRLRAGTRTLLSDVCFTLRAGEFVAVLGANGAGKTTLLRTLAGVRAPDFGRVTIGKRDAGALTAAQRARAVAHIASDEVFIDQLTVRDVVSTGRYAHHQWWEWREDRTDDASISAALQAVHMEPFAQRPFATLSSGERQRIWLALALAQEAPVLLLDEPTSHLDVRVAQEILHLLRAQANDGKTVVCVLHDVNEAAQFADRIMLLGDGGLLALDTPQAVLTSPLLEIAYGIRMQQLRTPEGQLRVFPAARTNSSEPSVH